MVNRWGAYGAFVAGLTFVVGYLWSYMGEVNPTAATLVLLGHLGVFFALWALHARLHGSLADYGTLLAVAGNGVVCGIAYAYIAVGEGVLNVAALESGMLGMVGLGGISVFTLGLVLLGIAVAQHATLPTPLGGMFVVAALLTYVGGFTTEIVFTAGAVIGGLALLWLGAVLNEGATDREVIAA